MAKNQNPKIVVIGGGTGIFNTLRGLKKRRCDITAIVNMADDGGSTGKLRDDYGVLPPGDIRQALVALSSSGRVWRDLFTFRFKNGGLEGHNFGNLFLSALEQTTGGNFMSAIDCAAEILEIKGRVVPVTLTNTRLKAELENGQIINGEHHVEQDRKPSRVKRVFLIPTPKANPAAIKAISKADLIVIGPGSLFTSILPNLVVPGVAAAIKRSRAKKIFVCNIMTQANETPGYTLADFLQILSGVLGSKPFNHILVNRQRPSQNRLRQYAEKGAARVELGDLPKSTAPLTITPLMTPRGLIRHDPKKIADALWKLV